MSLSDQLRPLIEQWASHLVLNAGDSLFALSQERCPSDEGSTGELKRSGSGLSTGDLTYTIEYTADHASYTDEGVEAHRIYGNPLLHFYWDKLGRDVWFRYVDWVPGPGIAFNIGWFGDTVDQEGWEQALVDQAEFLVSLDG